MNRPLLLGVLFLCACDGGGRKGGRDGGGDLPGLEPRDGDGDGVDSDTDCNDSNRAIFPGAFETCNALDDDCNGNIDDGLATVTYYRDADRDMYGDHDESATACTPPNGFVTNADDCDDSNAIVRPGAQEVCDLLGVDENCNGLVNEDDPGVEGVRTWYVDADEDGYGTTTTVEACFEGLGLATVNTDCNDADYDRNPGTPEICDPLDKDEDCDGYSDVNDPEGPLGQPLYYIDVDGDDDGDMTDPGQYFCDGVPPGYSTLATDCDDDDAIMNPAEPEKCEDLIDNDCNGAVDDCGPIPDIPTDTADVTISKSFTSYSYFGWTLNSMGDLNGDGQGDFGVGAWKYDFGKGAVFLFEGPVGVAGTYAADDIYAGSLEGDVIYGEFGWTLDTAGDVNGDGFDDVLVGMQSYDKGHAYLFLGPVAGDSTAGAADATWSAEEPGDYANVVAGNFDFDGDGTPDYAIGAYQANSDATSDVGATYLVYGPGTGSDTSLADTPLKFIGTSTYDCFGAGLTGVNDMNGDGTDELVVGAYQAESNYGAVYIFDGGSLGGEISASSADATIKGNGTYQYFGRYLSRLNDFNNDGYGDLLAEAPNGHSSYGSVYVFLGPASSGNADTIAQAEIHGEHGGMFDSYDGNGPDGAGDVNRDGFSDLLIGGPYYSPGGGVYSSGIGYLMYGPQTGDVSLANARCAFPGTVSNDLAGMAMSFIGDQTGDDSPEVLIGGPYALSYYGAAWMVFSDRLY
jgi:hypothetical protein